jgi:hypothetical protein
LPVVFRELVRKFSVDEFVSFFEEFVADSGFVMSQSSEKIFNFLKKQKSIKGYLDQIKELEHDKSNKDQIRLLIQEAKEKGLDLEVEVSEDEVTETSDSISVDDKTE